MNNENIEEKYQDLKQLLIDGKSDIFENEIAQLQFDELGSFYGYIYNQNKEAFDKNYYGAKILGELAYNLSARKLIILDEQEFDIKRLKDFMLQALQSSKEKLFNWGYYEDARKYALTILNFYEINNDDRLSILSTLAHCAFFQNNRDEELFYTKKMLLIDSQNPKILLNYSFALMRNKKFDESKINLEKCLELGYENFQVYNQLASIYIYGYKDFYNAFLCLETIFSISNGGQDLDERSIFFLFHNFLLTLGLSGNSELLPYIQSFKEKIHNTSKHFYILAGKQELMNQGIAELNNKNLKQAQDYFLKIEDIEPKDITVELSIFFKNISRILEEYQKVQKLEDIESLLIFTQKLEVHELFQEYKEVIENYFYLLNGFILLIEKDLNIENYEQRKNQVKKFDNSNLTTSEFVYKSFEIIKLIDSYISDYSNSILKNNLKKEYQRKLKKLIGLPFNINNETTFMYSFNQATGTENIDMELSRLIIRSIELLQKNEPSFIKEYKSKKRTKLLESDFRDIFYLNFGAAYAFTVSAEAKSRRGLTDLQVESKKFGTKTFEFKIWGSNDYKDVVKQIYGYLTDFEDVGFVFMINKNKSSIEEDYILNLKKKEMGYIDDSLEYREVQNFNFFVSKHKINVKTKSIYHFIYNIF